MTNFTPTSTPQTGDENPGGTIRQGRGFGLSESAVFPTGDAGRVKYQQPARTMGEAGRNDSTRAVKAGGPCSASHSFSSVIGKGALRIVIRCRAGGPGGASIRKFFVAFNEVVFCSGAVPGGAAC
jgi:hypothetical protein